MAQLTVTLHDGQTHQLKVADDYEIPALNIDWITFTGVDGVTVRVNSRSIAAVVVGPETSMMYHFPAEVATKSPDDPPKEF
jgi:hypothetical protein